MKRLFSKKSGFTLVEIIIAFAVFAVMASMLVQILNLTINRKNENLGYEKYLQDQEKTLVANGQKWNIYDEDADIDGSLALKFKDKNGNDVLDASLDYQLVSVDGTLNDASGVNYFVGNIDYAEGGSGTVGGEDDPEDEEKDESELGGSSQMSRFDTRITGTKGINSIKITWTYNASNDEYTFAVTVQDSGVDSAVKSHSQVSIFFGEGTSGGKMATITSLNGGTTNQNTLKYVKKTGTSGVNIHCNGDGFNGSTTTFTVKFAEPINELGFGDNVTGGDTYSVYKGYANIFGAYEKASS